ncbi:MAG: helix-hairpin-helix domain-containing protein, partial [Fervidobacterium sp.]
VKDLRKGDEKIVTPPEKCPVCNGPVGKESGEYAAYKCLNPHCPAKLKRHLEVFVSRQALNIQGLGPKIISKLVDSGLIEDIADIFYLDVFKLSQISGMGPKMISNILNEIEKAKKTSLENLLVGLGIPGVGEKTAKVLAKKFKTLDALAQADINELLEVEGIGDDTAQNIVEYFKNEKTHEIIKKLREAQVNMESSEDESLNILNGLTFCITGTLSSMTREEVKRLIENYGGHFTDNVSKKTDYLICGENPGSKLEKAKKFGIKILNEDEFFNMLFQKGANVEKWKTAKEPSQKNWLF